jgi:hypothetical protein
MNENSQDERLEKLPVMFFTYLSQRLADDFLDAPQVDLSLYERWAGGITVRIIQEVYGRQSPRLTYRYPRDWWQAFKQRFLPAWALKRWPVTETELTVDVRLLYPKGTDESPVLHTTVRRDGREVWFPEYEARDE